LLSRALAAITTVLVVAVGVRLAWEFLRPALGPLLVLAMLLGIVGLVVRRRSWW
jgi:hypothetical protein